MDQLTRERLDAEGFRETSVTELLGLTLEEAEFIETRLALAALLRDLRRTRSLSQRAAAEVLGSDQANVSKAERSDQTVSLDWMIKAAISLGADRRQIGKALCG